MAKKVSFFKRLTEVFSEDIGIDLGTANTLVCAKSQGILICEPSVVAMNLKTDEIFAIGKAAKDMLGKTPKHIEAIKPLKDGVIADYDMTEKMLKDFLQKVKKRKFFGSQRVVICVPAGVTHVEKRAVQEVVREAGAREALLIEEPMAAAIGAGLDVFRPDGHLIVDIGGGTSEIAIISLGGIVITSSLRLAGNKIDDAIIQFVRKEHNVNIGEQTAEEIKIGVGSPLKLEENKTMKVNGRSAITGLPCDFEITSREIEPVIGELCTQIVEEIKAILEQAPPEISADINKRGIMVAGGGALIPNIDKKFAKLLNLPVTIAENPLNAVINGIYKVLENYEEYKDVLVTEIQEYS